MFARLLLIMAGLLLVAGASAFAAPAAEAPELAALGPNLLNNPSFEGEYSGYVPPGGHPDCETEICDTAQMAPGWTPYWRSHQEGDTLAMPEYKPIDRKHTDPVRVRSGDTAQAYFTFWRTHEAGFYQQATVTPGETYCFSAWGHSWSAEDDEDWYSGPFYGNFRQRVGIDPTGGTDWQSGAIEWGPLQLQYDYYAPFAVSATAQASTLTVYVYSQPEWAVKHNDAYWDDANLRQIAPVLPDGELLLVVPPGDHQTVTKTINTNWLCDPETSWELVLDLDGTLTPTLSATSGQTGSALTVTLDSVALPPGDHQTVLHFSSPDTAQPVAAVPARIVVLEDVHNLYLPAVIGGE